MQIQELKKDATLEWIRVDLPREMLQDDIDAWFNTHKDYIAIDGFRKGKAPLEVIKKNYSARAREEALKELRRKALRFIFEKKGYGPKLLHNPSIIDFKESDDEGIYYVYELFLAPEINWDNVKDKLAFSSFKVTLTDEEVLEEAKKIIIDPQKKYLSSKKKTKDEFIDADDHVTYKLSVYNAKGRKVPLNYKEDDFSFSVGDESTYLVPFGSAVYESFLGLPVEGDFSTSITIDDALEPLVKNKGQTLTFKFHVLRVQPLIRINNIDEYIANYNLTSKEPLTLEVLVQRFRDSFSHENETLSNIIYKKKIFDVLEQLDFSIPETFCQKEFDSLKKQFTLFNRSNTTEDVVETPSDDELMNIAKRRVRLGIVLNKVLQDENKLQTQESMIEFLKSRPWWEARALMEKYKNIESLVQETNESLLLNWVKTHYASDLGEETISLTDLKQRLTDLVPGISEGESIYSGAS